MKRDSVRENLLRHVRNRGRRGPRRRGEGMGGGLGVLERCGCAVAGVRQALGWGFAGAERAVPDAEYEAGARARLAGGVAACEFMNWGFAPATPRAERLAREYSGATDPEAVHSLAAYLRVFEEGCRPDALAPGSKVLEVGSGRGAGLSLLSKEYPAFTFVGLDTCQGNLACSQTLRSPRGNVTWVKGDAMDLPFADGSMDAIICIESSHCFADFERFLAEVRRVLRPGGRMSLSDLRWREQSLAYRAWGTRGGVGLLQPHQAAILDSGMHLVRQTDITRNVVSARELCTEFEVGKLRSDEPDSARRFYSMNQRALVGTSVHRWLKGGQIAYFHWVLEKPFAEGPRHRLLALRELYSKGLLNKSVYEKEQALVVAQI